MSADDLLQAAAQGGAEHVAALLADGADPALADDFGFTALHMAKSDAVVELLLAGGADVNARSASGVTPLHQAVGRKVTAALLRAGADVGARTGEGATPLHKAMLCSGGHEKLLIDAGADVHAVDNTGATPLHIAARRGFAAATAALVDAGADIAARDGRGATPLTYASEYRRSGIWDYLVRKGAVPVPGEFPYNYRSSYFREEYRAIDALQPHLLDHLLRNPMPREDYRGTRTKMWNKLTGRGHPPPSPSSWVTDVGPELVCRVVEKHANRRAALRLLRVLMRHGVSFEKAREEYSPRRVHILDLAESLSDRWLLLLVRLKGGFPVFLPEHLVRQVVAFA